MTSGGALGGQRIRKLDAGALHDGDDWALCLGGLHAIRDERVNCPARGTQVDFVVCLTCHHLETLAGERDPANSCEAAGPIETRSLAV